MNISQSSASDTSTAKFCPSCGAGLSDAKVARFCSQCGEALAAEAQASRGSRKSASLSVRSKLILVLLALGAFVPAVYFAHWKAGPIPTETVASLGEGAPLELPPAVQALATAAEKSPTDLRVQNAYAAELVALIRDQDEPPQALVLEAVQQLSRILQLNPNEADALLSLADISFNQQVFNKASDLYARYLTFRGDDLDVRARYGSTLMFMGDFKRSIEEQQKVLAVNPKHFQAAAYLAIATGEGGDIAGARKAGKRALELAPNDDARSRLNAFLASLDRKESEQDASRQGAIVQGGQTLASPAAGLSTTSQQGASGATSGSISQGNSVPGFEVAIRANPVAGPKVRKVTISNGVATVTMENFPMAAMPPFAKEKFYGTLQESARQSKVREVIFIDARSNSELERRSFP